MKRKLVIILLIVALVPTMLFAKTFGFNAGATVMYNVNATEVKDTSKIADIKNYSFGADLRLKLLVFNITAMGTYNGKTQLQNVSGDYQEISGLLAAGLVFDLFDMVRVGASVGPRVSVFTNGSDWKVFDRNGQPLDADFGNAFLNAPMSYRATVDFLLGAVSVGVSYMVDSNYTFANGKELSNLKPDWGQGKFGASVMFNM